MIQPQELRLGNLFQDAKGRLCKTEQISIDPYETKIRSIDHSITSMPIAAIPLTEEWLIKLGFHEVLGFYAIYGKELNIKLNTGYWEAYFKGKYVSVIKFVHQLQNLFFALTGQELVTKPANE